MADDHHKQDSTKTNQIENKEEELSIDFSKVKSKISGFFKNEKKEEHHSEHTEHKSKDEDLSIDFSSISCLAKKNAKWLIPVACILIAIIISVYLRTMPMRMPITDDWAQNTVDNYYQNNIVNQINQQYPNLPQQNKNALIESEFAKFKEQNKDQLKADIAQVSQQYKDQYRNDEGTLYLLGIDPWHYYRQSYYIINNGFPGSTIKDGQIWDNYRLAPLGEAWSWDFHSLVGAKLYTIMNWFGTFPLMYTFFFIGIIFSALAIIPAFFIGKRITKNNLGGFFTAVLVAVAAFFVQRTTGESSDTDVYVVFFPLLITWMFIEALYANKLKNKILWASLAGISTGIFSFAWSGWWYVQDIIIGTLIIYIVYLLITQKKTNEKRVTNKVTDDLVILGTYIITSIIFVLSLSNLKTLKNGLIGPLNFIQIKAVAVESLWPNILTTVAELNAVPLAQVISLLGGTLLVVLAIIGIILTALTKDTNGNRDYRLAILLVLWVLASLYATTKGVRFVLQAIPVFTIAFGAFLGLAWHYLSSWTSKELHLPKITVQIIIFVLLIILLIQPVKSGYDQAYNSVPSINDGWYNTLTKINAETAEDVIITSWWDFGYWFRAIADRPVTFDGGNQVGWDAHWVGKSLLTADEQETAGILMMLNCGQNLAFEELNKIYNDTPKVINIMHQMLVEDRENAIKTLKNEGLSQQQINGIIQYFHCNAPTDYFITSEDMIGKAGVWGHFGSWDFTKAAMYQEVNKLPRDQALTALKEKYNLSAIEAENTLYQIQNTAADNFVSPWPSYLSGQNECVVSANQSFVCTVGSQQGNIIIDINIKDYSATIRTGKELLVPNSLVYATKEGIKERKFGGNMAGFSVILLPSKEGYSVMLSDPLLANSVFTKLFLFEGHGLKCFKEFDDVRAFTGDRIITWQVDYECKQQNKVYFLPKEEVNAAHLLISINNRSEEEALKLIEDIKENITPSNFAEYALKYSEDSGSAANGGELGWFGKGMMVRPFEDVAFALKKGQISDPFKTQFGYHLIYVKDKRSELP